VQSAVQTADLHKRIKTGFALEKASQSEVKGAEPAWGEGSEVKGGSADFGWRNLQRLLPSGYKKHRWQRAGSWWWSCYL